MDWTFILKLLINVSISEAFTFWFSELIYDVILGEVGAPAIDGSMPVSEDANLVHICY